MTRELRIYIFWLIGLVILLVLVSAFTAFLSHPSSSPTPVATNQTTERTPPPQPPATAQDTVQAEAAQPFQYLVSYMQDGFEPATLTIKVGQTVRFTDNATTQLWVAADSTGGKLYPAVENGCGSSAFDSCTPLNPGYDWQFTFTTPGTWTYDNKLDKSQTGTITVQ